MNKPSINPGDYVREVTDRTLSHLQGLRDELTTLRELAGSLEQYKAALAARSQHAFAELDRRRVEIELQEQLLEDARRYRAMAEQYAAIEQQNASLANLYVASHRLHETMTRDEVVTVILEIVINLVGSERVGVYELEDDGVTLRRLGSFGLDEETGTSVAVSSTLIGRAVRTGRVLLPSAADLADADPSERRLTASIPLKSRAEVIGAIAIFDLLPHKPGLGRIDHELFELLATHAAAALRPFRVACAPVAGCGCAAVGTQ